MTKLIWSPEHGQQLKQLREAAGLSVAELATQHALSKGHVAQLEDGGNSAFYTAEIKFTVGRKLMRGFGHDIARLHEAMINESQQPAYRPAAA